VLLAPTLIWWTAQPGGGRWRDVAGIYLPPILMSAAALLPGLAVMLLPGHTAADDVVEMITALVTAPPIYLVLACKFMPADVAELAGHLGPLRRILAKLRLIAG
jgi:hypothetical protein